MKHSIKSQSLKNIICFVLMSILLGMAFLMFPTPTKTADAAASFTGLTVTDSREYFSMRIRVDARNSTYALPLDRRTVQTESGEIEFYCFQWRDVEDIHFRFSSNIKDSSYEFESYEFLATHLKTDDLDESMGVAEPEILSADIIARNTFSLYDFYYYIDSASDVAESTTRCKGHDFGLYKFNFRYTYTDEEGTRQISLPDIYIAILPDDIDEIIPVNTKIVYSIGSSSGLMNVFNLYLSSDVYKYVNPEYLKWNVVGVGLDKTNYVLSEEARAANLKEYANHTPLWSSPLPTLPIGTNFVFDSNNIEGKWSAYCTILNSDGSENLTLSVHGLSTVKVAKPSYTWIYFLIGGVVLVAGFVWFLIWLRKRQHNSTW